MAFDPKIKELARAHDAVDRLRDVKERMRREDQERASVVDGLVRGALLGLIAYILWLAFLKL